MPRKRIDIDNGFNPCWTDERDALVARCKKLAGGE